MKNRWFTLAEILIVVVLFGLLSGIIIQTYMTISQVSFRLHQEKEIAKEALILSQVLENLSQSTTIDYWKYSSDQLIHSQWIVEKLQLKGNDQTEYEISSTGSCISSKDLYDRASDEKKQEKSDSPLDQSCQLQLITTTGGKSQTSFLLDGKNFKMSQIQFKVMPFMGKAELKTALENEKTTPDDGKPAFWILGNLYSNYYNPHKRSNNILLPIQLFFSLQGETESIYSQTRNNETQH